MQLYCLITLGVLGILREYQGIRKNDLKKACKVRHGANCFKCEVILARMIAVNRTQSWPVILVLSDEFCIK